MSTGASYLDVCNAVMDYYGAESDIFARVVTQGPEHLQPWEIEEIGKIPGINICYDKRGSILGYDYTHPFKDYPIGGGSVNTGINSNNVPSQYGSNSFNGRVNGTYTWDGQLQRGGFSSGARSVSTGTRVMTVANKVGAAVAAVSIGMQLGAKIDSALYNVGKFFDLNPPEELNPATWADIATSEGGKDLIRTLFGIEDGATTMYMPKEAIDYMYNYWNSMNAFKKGAMSANYTPPQGVDVSGVPQPLNLASGDGTYTITGNGWPGYREYRTSAEYMVPFTESNTGTIALIWISRTPFTVEYKTSQSGEWYSGSPATQSTTLETGQTFYYDIARLTAPAPPSAYGLPDNTVAAIPSLGKIGTVIYDGSVTIDPGVTGFDKDPDQAQVNPDQVPPGQSVTDAYPNIFKNPIKESVPQADGSTRDIIYYPVPWPNATDMDRPVSDTSNQTDPEISDDSPDEEKEPLTDVITNPNPQPETPTPGPTATPPDTGSGSTPTVIGPTGNASSLWAIYNPTQAQLDAFGSWLWSSDFVEQIKKLFNDPMQAIVGVHKVFATPQTGGQVNIKCGYIDSGCPAAAVTSQYVTVDCGTVSLREYYGNVLDYAPYTEISLYLPFIGIVKLDIADIMRSSIKVIYHIDVITGACLADVKISRDGENAVLYQYSGSAIVTYPISSGSYASMVTGVLSLAAGVAGTIMTGGAAAPALIGGAVGLSHLHTDVQKSGGFSGSPGAMGCKKPYLIISRAQEAIPSDFEKYEGKPASKTVKIGNCDGFIKVKSINIDGIPRATYGELDQIVSLLKQGVIL